MSGTAVSLFRNGEVIWSGGYGQAVRARSILFTADTEGQTKAIEGDANVKVCLEPDVDAIKQMLGEVLSAGK